MLRDVKIADIQIGKRHRKDLGDLTSLAESIRQIGLLQPIGVTDNFRLVFGERRLRAQRDILKKKTILTRIVNVSSIVSGEYAENEIRKDFTPSERVAIAQTIEKQVGNRQGQRTDKRPLENFPEVTPGNVGKMLTDFHPLLTCDVVKIFRTDRSTFWWFWFLLFSSPSSRITFKVVENFGDGWSSSWHGVIYGTICEKFSSLWL